MRAFISDGSSTIYSRKPGPGTPKNSSNESEDAIDPI